MRPILLAVLLSGCTVHHHHYPAAPVVQAAPGRMGESFSGNFPIGSFTAECTPTKCPGVNWRELGLAPQDKNGVITAPFYMPPGATTLEMRLDHGTADQKEKILAP